MGATLTLRQGQGTGGRAWAPTVPFRSRLATFRGELQTVLDKHASADCFQPRLPVTVRISLDELAGLLPPAEGRLLVHLRARRPLERLVGSPGYRSRARLNAALQRLLSRIQAYCGAHVRHAVMQRYDRPGHHHRRRVGRPRTLLPRDQLPALVLWVPAIPRPTAAGLSMLLPPRPQPGRSNFPLSQRAAVGTLELSWPELLACAVPWLSP